MAGGQYRRDGQRPLSQVLRADDAVRDAVERPAGRHCWVQGPPEEPGPWPGVVIAWQRGPRGWRGRVVYVVVADGDVLLVETWVPAEKLRPVA